MQDTPPRPRPPGSPVPRRVLLGAGLGGVLVLGAGCSTTAPTGSATGSSGSPAGGSTGKGDNDDPDAQLVTSVLAGLSAARALVLAVRRRHDDLAAPLAGLARLHRAHGRELGGLPTASASAGSGVRPAARPAVALTQVSAGEQELEEQLVAAAVEARSGVLAGLLASMAAAVAQELSLLAASGGRG